MVSKSTAYEQFVTTITQALLRAQGLETVRVQHDVQVQGLSRSHQVDVYWEYRLGGVLHRVVVNCKHYADTVEVTHVLTLGGVLHDMPGVRGVIVTTVGFQKGAIDYAKTHQIGLKVIRPPEDEDWEGRIREIHINLSIAMPELLECSVALDREWAKANITDDPDSLAGSSRMDARKTVVRDLETGTVSDMNALWNRAMSENPTEAGSEGTGILKWKDARLEQPTRTSLRVEQITFRWKIHRGETQQQIIRKDPAAIVRDAIAGTLLFVDPDGRVGGDTEEEFGNGEE